MEQELRDRLLTIADEKAAKIGVDGLHGLIDQACTIFERLALYLGPMRTREGLLVALDSVELSQAEERFAMAMAEHFGHFIREAVTALFETGIKELPPVPGGRKRVLTTELAQQINGYVLHLYESEVDLKNCKKRAAQKFGISYTTVQRAWSNRVGLKPTIDASEFVEFIRRKLAEEWIIPSRVLSGLVKECTQRPQSANRRSRSL